MDMDEETAKFKWLLIAGLVFLVSAYFSWQELRYAAFGSATDARVVRVQEYTEVRVRGGNRQRVTVQYEFKDEDGAVRRESDQVSPGDLSLDGPTVRVQYIGGTAGASRLPANAQRWWLVVFFGSLGLAGFWVWRIVRASKS